MDKAEKLVRSRITNPSLHSLHGFWRGDLLDTEYFSGEIILNDTEWEGGRMAINRVIRLYDNIVIDYVIVGEYITDIKIWSPIYYKPNDLIEFIEGFNVEDKEFDEGGVQESDSYKLSVDSEGFLLEAIDIYPNKELGVELVLNGDTYSKYKEYVELFRDSEGVDNNLIIFKGNRGLGKTTTSFKMLNSMGRTPIFIPNTLIEYSIQNSEFVKFLKTIDKPALIIDDCEYLTNLQFHKMNMFTHNILQLLDTPIMSGVDLTIILISNSYNLDPNLLDSNSFRGILEFKNLTTTGANKLSKGIKSNIKYRGETRLIDVIRGVKPKCEIMGL